MGNIINNELLQRLYWERFKTERYINQAVYIKNNETEKEAYKILESSLWVDGTIDGQIQYALKRRRKIDKLYEAVKKHLQGI